MSKTNFLVILIFLLCSCQKSTLVKSGFSDSNIVQDSEPNNVIEWNHRKMSQELKIEQIGSDSIIVTWNSCTSKDLRGYFVYLYEAEESVRSDLDYWGRLSWFVLNSIRGSEEKNQAYVDFKYVTKPICAFSKIMPGKRYVVMMNAVPNEIPSKENWEGESPFFPTFVKLVSKSSAMTVEEEKRIKDNSGEMKVYSVKQYLDIINDPAEYSNLLNGKVFAIEGMFYLGWLHGGPDYWFLPGYYLSGQSISGYFSHTIQQALEFGISDMVFNEKSYMDCLFIRPNYTFYEDNTISGKLKIVAFGEDRVLPIDSVKEKVWSDIKTLKSNVLEHKNNVNKNLSDLSENSFFNPKYIDKNGNYHYFVCCKMKVIKLYSDDTGK